MQLGISTASFHSRILTEDALNYIGKIGAKKAEVFLDTFSEYESSFGDVLLTHLAQTDVQVIAIHAMAQQFEPQLFSIGQRQKQDAWEMFEKVLRQGKNLGASHYVMHGPARLKGALKNAGMRRIGPIVAEAADLALQYGLKLCFENVSWCMFHTPEFAQSLSENCKSDNLFFTLDIKQAIRSGYDPFAYVSAMGDRLAHVHLCDFILDADGNLLGTAMPGKGVFDFHKLAQTLKSNGYKGDAMLEVYSDLYGELSELKACYDWLREVMEY